MIGIFDSGSGGLSVASEVVTALPNVDVVYLGDTKNMPYGNKSSAELFSLTHTMISFLISQQCTTLISACNSISSQVILNEHFHHEIPIIEMVHPTVSHLAQYTHKKIALAATPATIASALYQKELKNHNIVAHMIPNPNLAVAIETNNTIEILKEIQKILSECEQQDSEILSLSCTHYPLVKEMFITSAQKQNFTIEIFDPSTKVAQEVTNTVTNTGHGTFKAYTTNFNPHFYTLLKQKIPHATHEVISL